MEATTTVSNQDPNAETPAERPPSHFAKVVRALRPNRKPSYELSRAHIDAYLRDLGNIRNCHDVKGRQTKCRCFSTNFEDSWIPHMSQELYRHHITLTPAERDVPLLFMAKVVLKRGPSVPCLPVPSQGFPEGHAMPFPICSHSYWRLMNVGERPHRRLMKLAKAGGVPSGPRHGLMTKERSNRSCKQPIVEAFRRFMDTLIEEEGTEMHMGIQYANNAPVTIELPSHYSTRKLYMRFCRELGYEVNADSKICGVYNGNEFVGPDRIIEQKDVMSSGSFRRYWEQEYPHVVILNPNFQRGAKKRQAAARADTS